jgi:hypothetical protein
LALSVDLFNAGLVGSKLGNPQELIAVGLAVTDLLRGQMLGCAR